MTSWIVLCTVIALFALLTRCGRSTEPPLPPGYEGERQLAELRAQRINPIGDPMGWLTNRR